MDWPFDQPRNCAVFTLRTVMSGQEPIVRVTHDEEDHGWQFIGPSGASIKQMMIVALEEIVELDESVFQVADIPPGWCAVRESPAHPWVRAVNTHS